MSSTPLRPLELLAQHHDDQSTMLLEQTPMPGYQSYTILETTYGLRLGILETTAGQGYGDIVFLDQKNKEDRAQKRRASPSHLSIHPEWEIRCDDYDDDYEEYGNDDDPDDLYIGEDIVCSRYPALAPFFLSWRTFYNSATDRQEYLLKYVWDAVPDVRVRVAWEVKGFLVSCWLALQGDAGCVSYESHGLRKYDIYANSADMTLRWFLRDMEALIVFKGECASDSEEEYIGRGCSVI